MATLWVAIYHLYVMQYKCVAPDLWLLSRCRAFFRFNFIKQVLYVGS